MSTVHVVVGGQYGSEAKGHVTAQLTLDFQPNYVMRVAGPNAGHTAINPASGEPVALRQIPCAAVVDHNVELLIGAGSEVDAEVLVAEIDKLEEMGIPIIDRLWVDPQATILEPRHRATEHTAALNERIGSTGKGVGAARADRLMRRARIWADVAADGWRALRLPEEVANIAIGPTAEMAKGADLIIEGTQGYGLGLHAGHYPFCTSSDATAADFLAMAGVVPWERGREVLVWPVFRTYPIRVAGSSGPLLGETSWEALGEATGGYIKEERTTVTGKTRRVGQWDTSLALRALAANGHPSSSVRPVLTFLDYWFPDLAGETRARNIHPEAWAKLDDIAGQLGIGWAAATTGPSSIIWL